MQVKEIMTPDPTCCTPDTMLQRVAEMMVEHDCGEIPVVENMANMLPVGVVTDRDITCRTVAHNLQYALVNFVLLWFADHNGYSIDRLRHSSSSLKIPDDTRGV